MENDVVPSVGGSSGGAVNSLAIEKDVYTAGMPRGVGDFWQACDRNVLHVRGLRGMGAIAAAADSSRDGFARALSVAQCGRSCFRGGSKGNCSGVWFARALWPVKREEDSW